jgi:hypothetical protein
VEHGELGGSNAAAQRQQCDRDSEELNVVVFRCFGVLHGLMLFSLWVIVMLWKRLLF